MHPPNRIHLLSSLAERRVDVNSSAGDAHPQRTEMIEHHTHIRWLAENALVRKHSMIHQIVCAEAVAAIFLALVFAPLRFLDFASDGGNNDIAFQFDSRALQGLDGVGVTN